MAANDNIPVSEVLELREQGLTDNLIAEELKNKGFNEEQIEMALTQAESSIPEESSGMDAFPSSGVGGDENVYERIEQITESMIDEKWDELISEVRKIIEWKETFENKHNRLVNDLDKLKEDFNTLHQGVLGKLEDYDKRMQDVGTELNAVGKVFKDVVPEFVENVKELKGITGSMKK